MRVSQYHGLGQTQGTLDFVDVDVVDDVKLFVDPSALMAMDTHWGHTCRSLIQNYFDRILTAVIAGDEPAATDLLAALREPNETHLGLSKAASRGSALGEGLAKSVYEALTQSAAVQSGLLADLEDTILFVPGISKDRVSDISTVLIREPLIAYTQAVCDFYSIPMADLDSGPLWQPQAGKWISRTERLPEGPDGKRVLLVPKVLVRSRMNYDFDEYYRHYVLEHMVGVHLSQQTALVHLLRNGEQRVYKTDLEALYGKSKDVVVDLTQEWPAILGRYRADKADTTRPALDHESLAVLTETDEPDWDELVAAVKNVSPGPAGATDFHRAIEALLTALFYPSLTYPYREAEIHQGRKRVDIKYTNTARSGFFQWVADKYGAPFVMVECKNYSGDPKNPELDQLAGRFSNSRGWLGLLVCRELENRDLFTERCRDTATDGRGYIVTLTDGDIEEMVALRNSTPTAASYESLLRDAFDRLV